MRCAGDQQRRSPAMYPKDHHHDRADLRPPTRARRPRHHPVLQGLATRSRPAQLFPASTAFVVRTGGGPTSLPQLRRLLGAERNQGWAEEDGLITEGLRSVAACAFDHSSRPIAAISVTRRTDRSAVAVGELVRTARHSAQQLTWACQVWRPRLVRCALTSASGQIRRSVGRRGQIIASRREDGRTY
ncbi:MAG: IclR family transcriptional regulator domain-containing protein [Mycobacterium sp.]